MLLADTGSRWTTQQMLSNIASQRLACRSVVIGRETGKPANSADLSRGRPRQTSHKTTHRGCERTRHFFSTYWGEQSIISQRNGRDQRGSNQIFPGRERHSTQPRPIDTSMYVYQNSGSAANLQLQRMPGADSVLL